MVACKTPENRRGPGLRSLSALSSLRLPSILKTDVIKYVRRGDDVAVFKINACTYLLCIYKNYACVCWISTTFCDQQMAKYHGDIQTNNRDHAAVVTCCVLHTSIYLPRPSTYNTNH